MSGMKKHIGEIAIAEVLSKYHDKLYNVSTMIKSGPAKGNFCTVSYKGDVNKLINKKDKKILIRVDKPVKEEMEFFTGLIGYFLTSKIPEDFSHAKTNEVVFCCPVPNDLKGEYHSPNLEAITNFYNYFYDNLGAKPANILHFSENKFLISAFLIRCKKERPYNESEIMNFNGIDESLEKYIAGIKRNSIHFITFDESILFNCVLEYGLKRLGLKYIQLEPQQ